MLLHCRVWLFSSWDSSYGYHQEGTYNTELPILLWKRGFLKFFSSIPWYFFEEMYELENIYGKLCSSTWVFKCSREALKNRLWTLGIRILQKPVLFFLLICSHNPLRRQNSPSLPSTQWVWKQQLPSFAVPWVGGSGRGAPWAQCHPLLSPTSWPGTTSPWPGRWQVGTLWDKLPQTKP